VPVVGSDGCITGYIIPVNIKRTVTCSVNSRVRGAGRIIFRYLHNPPALTGGRCGAGFIIIVHDIILPVFTAVSAVTAPVVDNIVAVIYLVRAELANAGAAALAVTQAAVKPGIPVGMMRYQVMMKGSRRAAPYTSIAMRSFGVT